MSSATPDNAGNELTDVLPSSLTLTGATATSGTAATAGNTVTWNGSVPAGGSVTITITATIKASAADSVISNQATFAYDADLNGTNESTGTTDDPTKPGANDPTTITVAAAGIADIPTLSDFGLLALGFGLAFAAWITLRRRPRQASRT